MDLGFDAKNQIVGRATTQAILESTKAQERAIDEELKRYDDLLESNDDELEILRARRLEKMKMAQKRRETWRSNGHGTYVELSEGGQQTDDAAKAFFAAAKVSERMVVHFYRPTTRYCHVFHAHLGKLSETHLETRFCKINVEQTEGRGVNYLVQKLGIVVMPTLLLVKNGKAIHHIRGFDELGGPDQLDTNVLACILGTHEILTPTEAEREALECPP